MINLIDVEGNEIIVDNTTGMLGHVWQRQSLYVYFAQLRHRQENTDLRDLVQGTI